MKPAHIWYSLFNLAQRGDHTLAGCPTAQDPLLYQKQKPYVKGQCTNHDHHTLYTDSSRVKSTITKVMGSL